MLDMIRDITNNNFISFFSVLLVTKWLNSALMPFFCSKCVINKEKEDYCLKKALLLSLNPNSILKLIKNYSAFTLLTDYYCMQNLSEQNVSILYNVATDLTF